MPKFTPHSLGTYLSISMHSLQEGKSGRTPEDNPGFILSFKWFSLRLELLPGGTSLVSLTFEEVLN